MILLVSKSSIHFNNPVSVYTRRLAEGLVLNGEQVAVMLLTLDYTWDSKMHNDVLYLNSMRYCKRNNLKIIRILVFFYKTYIRSWFLLRQLKKTKGLRSIIEVSETNSFCINLMAACRALGIEYYRNYVENPKRAKMSLSNQIAFFLTPYFSKGIICISYNLKQIFPGRNVLVMPPTVEEKWLSHIPEYIPDSLQFSIGYCGTITMGKDGFDILIESLKLIDVKLKPRIRVVAIGDSGPFGQPLEYWKKWVKDLDLGVEVTFTGRLDNYEVMHYLSECSLLALTRPDNFQNRYGFPSKLPEYLSTGRPVLVSRVSDIPSYLQDGFSAYLLDKITPQEIAQKIEYIINHPVEMEEVGQQGFQIACRVFSNKIQGKRVLDFLA